MASIKSQLKGIDKAIIQGSVRALNRALSSAKTQLVRNLKEDTGLKTDKVNSRVFPIKANNNKLLASLNVAVKFGVPLRQFSPKQKTVRVKHSTGGRARAHYGVTVKLGKQNRQLVPGAFLLDNKAGLIVVGRKGAFRGPNYDYVNRRAARKPLVQLRTTIFQDSAHARKAEATKYMQQVFDKNINHEIEFAISKKFSK